MSHPFFVGATWGTSLRRSLGSGFRVQGSGFRVQGSGFRVQGTVGLQVYCRIPGGAWLGVVALLTRCITTLSLGGGLWSLGSHDPERRHAYDGRRGPTHSRYHNPAPPLVSVPRVSTHSRCHPVHPLLCRWPYSLDVLPCPAPSAEAQPCSPGVSGFRVQGSGFRVPYGYTYTVGSWGGLGWASWPYSLEVS
jgi:hypothetical protein